MKSEKEILKVLINGLIDNPRHLVINESGSGDLINFDVFVDRTDMGRIIGKNGATILAIKNVATSQSTNHIRINVDDFGSKPRD